MKAKLFRCISVSSVPILCVALSACGALCDNAGVAVDNSGHVIVATDQLYPTVSFVSPNSDLLNRFLPPPSPPHNEQVLTGYGGYALSRDGRFLYLLRNTADHPNLIYRVELRTGRYYLVGNEARSEQSSIAASGNRVYQAWQFMPEIRLNGKAYIRGSKTRLDSPVSVSVAPSGEVCALESEVREIRCYDRGGNVAPSSTLHLGQARFSQIDSFTFDRQGNYVVAFRQSESTHAGTIAVFARGSGAPKLLRAIQGSRTHLNASDALAVDKLGNILTLDTWDQSNLLIFDKNAHGDVPPRRAIPARAFPTNAFRMAFDGHGRFAILGSDGVAVYDHAPYDPKTAGKADAFIRENGWDVAFAAGDPVVAASDGSLVRYEITHGKVHQVGIMGATGLVNYDDPSFVAINPRGNVYTVSANGGLVIELPPNTPSNARPITIRHFRTSFDQTAEAFAVDGLGRLFFALKATNSIVMVEPDGSQHVLSGSHTGLSGPSGLAIGPKGELFVANSRGRDILVFSASPRGNAAPIRTISGYSTNLGEPMALALDARGRLYVFDGPSSPSNTDAMHFVRVYGAGASGDVRPLRTYSVKTQCWANGI